MIRPSVMANLRFSKDFWCGPIGRCIGFSLLLFVGLFLVHVDAHAKNYPDQGSAYAGCIAAAAAATGDFNGSGSGKCTARNPPGGYPSYFCEGSGGDGKLYPCSTMGTQENDHVYPSDQTCASRPPEYTWTSPTATPTDVCSNGCAYTYAVDATDPKGYVYMPGGGVCESTSENEPKIDTDGDGIPDDEDAFPNDPNESKDTDGDGIGDSADIAPEDPTNGEDDGEGNEKDNTSSGGGDCRFPPQCTGDGIACNTLFQTWKTRCAVEAQGGAISGNPGDCRSSYSCDGNATGCAQLAVQRAQLCQSPGTDNGGEATVGGGGSCSQPYVCSGDAIGCAQLRQAWLADCRVKSLFDGNGDDDMGTDLSPGDFIGVSETVGDGVLDASGWLSGRSCPALTDPAFAGLGNSVSTGVTALCNGVSALAVFVLVLAYLHASWIIGRAVTGGGA